MRHGVDAERSAARWIGGVDLPSPKELATALPDDPAVDAGAREGLA
ncbi:hypothetical protein [Nocardia blacklockiae]|nr:hypothetical protein [Nocardia blacklockiae]MBF6171002.1 hypothetical protein [Nocardia blacklockiae]